MILVKTTKYEVLLNLNQYFEMDHPLPNIEVIKLCPAAFLLNVPKADVAWIFNPWPDITKYLDDKKLRFNGVVCPDIRLQQGRSCNLIEFPLFHAMYIQGMVFRGEKPVLVGTQKQLLLAGESFRRGVYGFYDESELAGCDLDSGQIHDLMQEITGLASDQRIKDVDELVDLIALNPLVPAPQEPVATDYHGLRVWKKDVNVFAAAWQDEEVTIDCNLGADEKYVPPLKIDIKNIPITPYQVIDTGEEDGFAPQSCMHTVLRWQNKIICIDLPMNASYLLDKISVSPTQLDVVLFTHNHDDHIGDFSLLLHMDKKVTVICPKVIWRSILLKAAMVFAMSVEELESYVDYQPIGYGPDNELEYAGLRIEAYPSIHSVPCAVYRIRAQVDGEWKIYSHLSDILNFQRCNTLVEQGFISKERFQEYRDFLLYPTNLKKIDVGTPDGAEAFSVHGSWKDFTTDKSTHIVLGHIQQEKLNRAATVTVGQFNAVGTAHNLAKRPSREIKIATLKEFALSQLTHYFSTLLGDQYEDKQALIEASLEPLANNEIRLIPPNTPFIKHGESAAFVDLAICGVGSVWHQDPRTDGSWSHVTNIYPGDLIGDMGVLRQCLRNASVRADTYMYVLRIPDEQFRELVIALDLFSSAEQINGGRKEGALQTIWRQRMTVQASGLVCRAFPVNLQNRIARQATEVTLLEGADIDLSGAGNRAIYLADDPGAITLRSSKKSADHTAPDRPIKAAVYGERGFLTGTPENYLLVANRDTTLLRLDADRFDWMNDVPVLKTRLRELVEQRQVYL